MTIKQQEITITDGNLNIRGSPILTQVPENIFLNSDTVEEDGVFVSAVLEESKSRHVFPLGKLQETRLLACFRFKLWWMSHMAGSKAQDIPKETQFLLLETKYNPKQTPNKTTSSSSYCYTAMFPLIESSFRASFQGGHEGILELCLESGDTYKKSSFFNHCVFIKVGDDPFSTIAAATSSVQRKLKSFHLRRDKTPPRIVDYFGWCTWDAFYQEVTQEGVLAGVETLAKGGSKPGFVIIDDGWQCTAGDKHKEKGSLERLTSIKENKKFDLRKVVEEVKKVGGVKYVYVWHALAGYWGGVEVGGGMEKYSPLLKYPVVSEGVRENERGWEDEKMAVEGVGMVAGEKVFEFYDDMHGYLEEAGVDGVKVDVQSIMETVGEGLGGRVEVTRRFHEALDLSVGRHFHGNGIIACMSHASDALYCSNQTALVRASDDFYPLDPISHSIHIAAVAYNSIFLGEFMLPDWDMFHSVHPAAEFHASARAVSGGPVYVSDSPGKHDFNLLKKLVLPDGSVLRARLPGRPTKDCLFSDPCRDGVSLLKIWNMNKHTGVIGVYNCQSAAWNPKEKKNTLLENRASGRLQGVVKPSDVHHITKITSEEEEGRAYAIYSHRSRSLTTVGLNQGVSVGLEPLEYEVFTVSPVEALRSGSGFAALGLIDMFNGGGAVDGVEVEEKVNGGVVVKVSVKGCGSFGAYSSQKPKECIVFYSNQGAGKQELLEYNEKSGLVTVEVAEMSGGDGGVSVVHIVC